MNALPPKDGSTSMVLPQPTTGQPEARAIVQEQDDESLIASWNTADPPIATNLVTTDPHGRAMLSRAMASADVKTRNLVGVTTKVIGYVAHVIEVADLVSGEVKRMIRVCMIRDDGSTASTCSKACVKMLAYLCKRKNKEGWETPLELEFREHPLPDGKSYCDVREVLPPKQTRTVKR